MAFTNSLDLHQTSPPPCPPSDQTQSLPSSTVPSPTPLPPVASPPTPPLQQPPPPPGVDVTSHYPKFKTLMCFFYKRNRCLNGDGCRFAHGLAELKRNQTSSLNSKLPPTYNTKAKTTAVPSSHHPTVPTPPSTTPPSTLVPHLPLSSIPPPP
eukprot:GHVQ01011590.1.p1 GENE.GHVQ01011590.1~~GHVQ01011590.1.p1  ORF type:complete len:153 (-),score=39.25 GHVQ01011590.1:16-474(-)